MGKLFNVGKRVLTKESIFMTHFTNQGAGKSRVAFAAPYPGKIMAVDLGKLGGDLICQKDAFLCAAYGTKLEIEFQKKLGAGFFGGEGFREFREITVDTRDSDRRGETFSWEDRPGEFAGVLRLLLLLRE